MPDNGSEIKETEISEWVSKISKKTINKRKITLKSYEVFMQSKKVKTAIISLIQKSNHVDNTIRYKVRLILEKTARGYRQMF